VSRGACPHLPPATPLCKNEIYRIAQIMKLPIQQIYLHKLNPTCYLLSRIKSLPMCEIFRNEKTRLFNYYSKQKVFILELLLNNSNSLFGKSTLKWNSVSDIAVWFI